MPVIIEEEYSDQELSDPGTRQRKTGDIVGPIVLVLILASLVGGVIFMARSVGRRQEGRPAREVATRERTAREINGEERQFPFSGVATGRARRPGTPAVEPDETAAAENKIEEPVPGEQEKAEPPPTAEPEKTPAVEPVPPERARETRPATSTETPPPAPVTRPVPKDEIPTAEKTVEEAPVEEEVSAVAEAPPEEPAETERRSWWRRRPPPPPPAPYRDGTTVVPGRSEPADPVQPEQPEVTPAPEGMVRVPAGNYFPDLDDESRLEHVPAFFIDQHPVTNREYKKFMDETGANPPVDPRGEEYCIWRDGNYAPGKENHPVVNVSFRQAEAYAEWADKSLPNEHQWQKAARGAGRRIFPWGDTEDPSFGNFKDNPHTDGTSPVGSFPEDRSALGVYDMAGNVREWVTDYYSAENRYWRTTKGGSFNDHLRQSRISDRRQGVTAHYTGFRCVAAAD